MDYNKEYNKYKHICILDLETTGVYWNADVPIQIAAIVVDSRGRTISEFNEKIKTTHKINPEASAVNHITAEDLINCRTEKEVMESFITWIYGNRCDCLLTYNGRAFDVPMLNKRCGILGIDTQIFNKESEKAIPHIDGYRDCVAPCIKNNIDGLKDALGRKWKLTLVSQHLHLNTEGAHDAYVDCSLLRNVFFYLDPLVHPMDWKKPGEDTINSLF